MTNFGLLRVAAVVPRLHLADPAANARETVALFHTARQAGANLVVFPEMGLTGYTCNDLFFQNALLDAARAALTTVAAATLGHPECVACVGLPVALDGAIFNCAAVVHAGRILGVVPKRYLPNYKEFYDARYFTSAAKSVATHVAIGGEAIPFGTDLLFRARNRPETVIGVEICEDLWPPVPPSSLQALHGATILVNLSASNETIGKAGYRRELVRNQSARCLAAYVYAAAGVGESTTDLVFGGHALVAENGTLLAESTRFEQDSTTTYADIDLEALATNRRYTTSFADGLQTPGLRQNYRTVEFAWEEAELSLPLHRRIDAHPFVPAQSATLDDRCDEIFHIQTAGLARRLALLPQPPAVAIGVSGGLDSTLALLVLCRTLDRLNIDRSAVRALTLPGFGTTARTLNNAKKLMAALGVSFEEIDIRPACLEQMRQLRHDPFGIPLAGHSVETLTEELRRLPAERRHDLRFENVQARMRTSLLMNTAFVIGTGDLSELALGWCTYNADHMSMYNPNVSVPKTLVKFLVDWAAKTQFADAARAVLEDIVATVISPELLPHDATGNAQSTEEAIGPYELHDFFIYHLLRFGFTPRKILYLAAQAKFDRDYPPETIRHWLKMFLTRFFASQFKRSCVPDGPKVGSISLSPRGDWRMPSDASARAWLDDLG